ncbi:transposable element Tcb2 transposase, partial [Zopfia rhizophila CBS 207.26]
LQEDNDPSHGTRSDYNIARRLKDLNWIDTPIQSPDLNPMEAVRNILKQRVRMRRWEKPKQLKEVLQDRWSKITMEEVWACIADMPRRCKI